MMRVVFVVIDALPNRWVGPERTPHLWELATNGGWNPEGGTAVLSTATYPNHATFATGRAPASHGILVNRVWDGEAFVGSHKVGPLGDTIFTAARRHNLTSTVVVGDHKLIGVMGGREAERHWPPNGRRADVALDEFRYAADSSVLDAVATRQRPTSPSRLRRPARMQRGGRRRSGIARPRTQRVMARSRATR